jgi:hypothetical protein
MSLANLKPPPPNLITMRMIGILTEDFELSYDLIRALKRRGLPMKCLDFREPVPADIGVVLTGPGEVGRIEHPRVLAVGEDREVAVSEAIKVLTGKESFRQLIVGVDPGEKRIGFAALGDGEVLMAEELGTVGEVEAALDRVRSLYPAVRFLVRVGHGSPTVRNRIVNAAMGRDLRVEITDETSTTRRVEEPDVEAAISIAGLPGSEIEDSLPVAPSDGELRHIKKLSRERSGGELTISTSLARRVALGELTLEEAIALKRGSRDEQG